MAVSIAGQPHQADDTVCRVLRSVGIGTACHGLVRQLYLYNNNREAFRVSPGLFSSSPQLFLCEVRPFCLRLGAWLGLCMDDTPG